MNPSAQEFRPTYLYYPFPPPPPPPLLPTVAAFLIPPSSNIPTRALLLTSVPTNVSESTVRRELEVFGDVRAVQMERLRDGIVTVHFYDLRQATEALNKIQEQHMHQHLRLRQHFDGLLVSSFAGSPPLPLPAPGLLCGRVIWAQFAFPVVAGLPDRYNQGTVVITSDSDVTTGGIKDIFEPFGSVKEIRRNPLNPNQRFVEFYDTRDATKAVAAVHGQEINGKQAVVELHRHSGHKPDYKLNKRIQPPPIAPYGYQSQLPLRNDVVLEVNSFNSSGGFKKNVYKHRQSPEKWGNGGRNKAWKGARCNREKCGDPRFLIKGEGVVSSFQDSRTTVMIKNIPNKYSQNLLLKMLDNHCVECNEGGNQPLSSYDFVYLPIDFVNKCNVGYGFVNMTSPEATWRLYKAFNRQNWEAFNSKKICEISYARLQGLEALKEHFKKSKFPCEAEEYMPVVFTPPRDGRTVTHPTPVLCTIFTSSPSPEPEPEPEAAD